MLALLLVGLSGLTAAQEDDGFYVPDAPSSRVQILPLYHSYDGITWEQRGDLTLNIQEERRRRSTAQLKTLSFDKFRLSSRGLYFISVVNEDDKSRIQAAIPVCYLIGSDLHEEIIVFVDVETAHVVSMGYKGATDECGYLTSAIRPQTSVDIGSTVQAMKPMFTVPKPVVEEQEQSFFGKYAEYKMSGNEPSDPPAEPTGEAPSSEPITLKVKAQDGSEIFFKIRPSTQLKKLMDSYCQRQGVDPKTVRFLFEGTRISETSTPRELGMQNDDSIDAMVEQRGG